MNSSGGKIKVVTNSYNVLNQITTALNGSDNSYWNYQYDEYGQVTSGKRRWSDSTLVVGPQFECNFDAMGNRQWIETGGDSSRKNLRQSYYTNNALKQITSRSIPNNVDVWGLAQVAATASLTGKDVIMFHSTNMTNVPMRKSKTILLNSLLLLIISGTFIASCQAPSDKHEVIQFRHSSDFSEQVLLLTEKIALFKVIKTEDGYDENINISLVHAHWGGEPELASSSGYLVDKWMVTGIRRITRIEHSRKFVFDTGRSSPQDPRYALVDIGTLEVFKSDNIEELKAKIGSINVADLMWQPANLHFDKMLITTMKGSVR